MAEEIYGFDESKSKVTLKSGAGITVGEDGTIGHTNEMEASASYVGGTTAVPMIKIDEQGHIVALTKQTIYPPTSAGEAGQVWTSDGAGAGKWAEPSGGEVWEEVDLANFPTDWVEGDRIKVKFKVTAYSSSKPSSWSSAPTTIEPSYIASESKSPPIIEFWLGTETYPQPIMPICITMFAYNSIAITMAAFCGVEQINSNEIIRLTSIAFNGGGFTSGSIYLDASNITTYVSKMWRLKQ